MNLKLIRRPNCKVHAATVLLYTFGLPFIPCVIVLDMWGEKEASGQVNLLLFAAITEAQEQLNQSHVQKLYLTELQKDSNCNCVSVCVCVCVGGG